MHQFVRTAASIVLTIAAVPGEASVTSLVIENRRRIEQDVGAVGQYGLLTGHYRGELDPADERNRIITDIQLALRNARGMVEYSTTFAMAKPVDMTKASRMLLFDTPNRGSGQAVADVDGHVHSSVAGKADRHFQSTAQAQTLGGCKGGTGTAV